MIYLKNKQQVRDMLSNEYFISYMQPYFDALLVFKKTRVSIGEIYGEKVKTSIALYNWIKSGKLADEYVGMLDNALSKSKKWWEFWK